MGVQMVTPDALSFGPRWLWPAIALPLLATLVAANPSRLGRESRDLREVSLGVVLVLLAANATALALLMHQLLSVDNPLAGRTLLLSAVGIWARNVLAFGIWYWEIDRGGPIRRCTEDHGPPDFLFPQMQAPAVAAGTWSPTFIDYLYVSLTNSTAFSPTDTMPLTTRVKLMMGAQALVSLATVAVVGARAVNILS
jgi:uncharacterized membrane protein